MGRSCRLGASRWSTGPTLYLLTAVFYYLFYPHGCAAQL